MSSPAPGLTCIGCGVERFQQFLQGPDRLQEIEGNYTLWRCPECGTFTLHPQPSPERNLDHYPADYIAYQPGQASGKLARCSSAYGAYKQVRFVLQRNPEPGWALDIGCGTGDFLAALRKHAWSVHGLEINRRIARYTHEQRGLNVIVGDSLAGAYASHSFDLITFWDVLEHLADPRQALREARRLARPSALLIIGIPNPESLEASLFGPYWAGWDIPRHLWLFPRRVLVHLVEEAGWEFQEVRYARGRHFLLSQSLRFWLQDRRLPISLSRLLLEGINSWGARALLLPYFSVVERFKASSSLVLFARRKEDIHA